MRSVDAFATKYTLKQREQKKKNKNYLIVLMCYNLLDRIFNDSHDVNTLGNVFFLPTTHFF